MGIQNKLLYKFDQTTLKFLARYMSAYANIKLCNKSAILKIVDYNMSL